MVGWASRRLNGVSFGVRRLRVVYSEFGSRKFWSAGIIFVRAESVLGVVSCILHTRVIRVEFVLSGGCWLVLVCDVRHYNVDHLRDIILLPLVSGIWCMAYDVVGPKQHFAHRPTSCGPHLSFQDQE